MKTCAIAGYSILASIGLLVLAIRKWGKLCLGIADETTDIEDEGKTSAAKGRGEGAKT